MKLTLPTDSAERKDVPVFSGVLKYAPAALAGVARISKAGNDKHNPGEPLHHARGKSSDHGDCIVRHAMDVADIEAHIVRNFDNDSDTWYKSEDAKALLAEASQLAWRALIWSQELHERFGGAPLAPGARVPSPAFNSTSGWADDKIKINPGDILTVGTSAPPPPQLRFLPNQRYKSTSATSVTGSSTPCGLCGKIFGDHSGGVHAWCPNPDYLE